MDQRNLVLAIVLSLVIMLGYQFVVVPYLFPEQLERQQAERTEPATPGAIPPSSGTLGAPSLPGIAGAEAPGAVTPDTAKSRDAVLAEGPRVRIETPALRGSISLSGGRIDDLVLTRYRETIESDSPEIVLLSP
jgi:YidC/Oxa1 family membrane protein insertase